MKDRLKKLLRRVAPGSANPAPCVPPPLPVTRTNRRPLTPLLAEDLAVAAIPTSPFFAVLPPDVRIEILVVAFCGLRLYVDLGRGAPNNSRPRRHCGRAPCLGITLKRDRIWRWTDGTCHRLPTIWLSDEWTPQDELMLPRRYCCIDGQAQCCGRACFLGVMGWLLSCRQAYAETVDLLWRANELVLTGDDTMRNLPRVFLPQRLTAITDIDALFAALTALPGLRHLILTLSWRGGNWIHEPAELDALDIEKSLFARLDRFMDERLRLERFTVAIPESLWTILRSRHVAELQHEAPSEASRLVPPENRMNFWHALMWRSLKSEGRDEPIDKAEHKNKHTFTRIVRMNETDESGLVISSNVNVTMPKPPAEYDRGKPVLDRGYCIVEGPVDWLARDTTSVNSGL
ncbi:hypothetical protein HYQ46_001755 [Verticillium longisporum]|nr:hypothetical protein HYQ46_001755 [Verticillium longisporum]